MGVDVTTSWYIECDQDQDISQGDILLNFPILIPHEPDLDFTDPDWQTKPVRNKVYKTSIVIMSQACDLVSDTSQKRKPIDYVLVCRIVSVADIGLPEPKGTQQFTKRHDFIKEIFSGSRPNLHMIGKHEGEPEINFHVVDFSETFSIPYKILEKYKNVHGKRLRLNTPHREYLSQRFGNFYTRIGLPNDDHVSRQIVLDSVTNDRREREVRPEV